MKKTNDSKTDLEICRAKIMVLLKEYNCYLETEDLNGLWIRDADTNETLALRKEY